MIVKGGAVGGGGLGLHLRSEENERIELVRSESIRNAVAELRGLAAGVTEKGLFHFQISPQPGQAWGAAEEETAIKAVIDEYGLAGQPMIVVRHKKDAQGVGRDTHLHIAALRVKPDDKVISDSFSKIRNEKVSRTLEHDLGHRIVPGRHNRAVMSRLRAEGRADVADWMARAKADHVERPEAAKTFEEHQKERRTCVKKADVAAQTLKAWRASDNGTAFRVALAEQGYRLARGREGGIMVVDPAGGAHELTNILRAGMKAEGDKRPSRDVRAEIDAKTADLDRTALPSVAEAVAAAREGVPTEPAADEAKTDKAARANAASPEAVAADRSSAEAILDRLTRSATTFTEQQLDTALKKIPAQDRDAVRVEILASAVDVAIDAQGNRRMTTLGAAEIEARLLDDAEALVARRSLALPASAAEAAIARAAAVIEERDGFTVSAEQKAGARHLMTGPDMVLMTGVAGSGKSTTLEIALTGWSEAGMDVRGICLSGIAAQRLAETGIKSETIDSQLLKWDRQAALAEIKATGELTGAGKAAVIAALTYWSEAAAARGQDTAPIGAKLDQVSRADQVGDLDRKTRRWLTGWIDRQLVGQLNHRSVLVVDEAGMVDTTLLSRVLDHARAAGTRVVGVGDPEQLQPVVAGAGFRILQKVATAAEIKEVVRQREGWMRRATELFSSGKADQVAEAVHAYAGAGAITVGIGSRLDPIVLRAAAETEIGAKISDQDAARLEAVAAYRATRGEAGALWREIEADAGRPDHHPLYDTFKAAQAERDASARAIGADLDGMRPWLERMAVNGEGLAADMLYAGGMRRSQAEEQAPVHAAELGLDQLVPPERPLEPDTGSVVRTVMFEDWSKDLARDGLAPSRLMMAYRRADVAILNDLGRGAYRAAGHLSGPDVAIATQHDGEASSLAVAVGDRLMCLKNDRKVGVKNGSTGTVTAIKTTDSGAVVLTVQLDVKPLPEPVTIDTSRYGAVAHAYAATIHRTQGVTVDRAWLLDDRLLDRHLAYVGMSRHRDAVRVFSAAPDLDALARRWGRARSADAISDYVDPRFLLRRPAAARADIRQTVGRAASQVRELGVRLYDVADHVLTAAPRVADGLSAALTPQAKEAFEERASGKPEVPAILNATLSTVGGSDESERSQAHGKHLPRHQRLARDDPPPEARNRLRLLRELPVDRHDEKLTGVLQGHLQRDLVDRGAGGHRGVQSLNLPRERQQLNQRGELIMKLDPNLTPAAALDSWREFAAITSPTQAQVEDQDRLAFVLHQDALKPFVSAEEFAEIQAGATRHEVRAEDFERTLGEKLADPAMAHQEESLIPGYEKALEWVAANPLREYRALSAIMRPSPEQASTRDRLADDIASLTIDERHLATIAPDPKERAEIYTGQERHEQASVQEQDREERASKEAGPAVARIEETKPKFKTRQDEHRYKIANSHNNVEKIILIGKAERDKITTNDHAFRQEMREKKERAARDGFSSVKDWSKVLSSAAKGLTAAATAWNYIGRAHPHIIQDIATKSDRIDVTLKNGATLRDTGSKVEVVDGKLTRSTADTIALAAVAHGWTRVTLTGSAAEKQAMATAMVSRGVQVDNPELKDYVATLDKERALAADRTLLNQCRQQSDVADPTRFQEAVATYQAALVTGASMDHLTHLRSDVMARAEAVNRVGGADQATQDSASLWAAEAGKLDAVARAEDVAVARA